MITVLHIISGLTTGGAENALVRLLAAQNLTHIRSHVISLRDRGTLADSIEATGTPVHTLGLFNPQDLPNSIRHLITITRHTQPDIIHGWLYHGNIAACLARRALPQRVPVLWSTHNSWYRRGDSKRSTDMIISLSIPFAQCADAMLYVSHTSAHQHEAHGYPPRTRIVIPYGFDVEHFQPLPAARIHVRESLGLSHTTPLIGLIARYHPMKDHMGFVRAAAHLAARNPEVQFVLAGANVDEHNIALTQQIAAHGIAARIHLLGEQRHIAQLLAALDIVTLSSSSAEGFPNIIGEAMACGVPCVVTDTGDSRLLVADTGIVVPPQNPTALARAWESLLVLPDAARHYLGMRARQRISEHFTLAHMVARYEQLYQTLIAR